ncbi:hypothetical protein ACTFIW_004286 [Dictyostelium discoideum]
MKINNLLFLIVIILVSCSSVLSESKKLKKYVEKYDPSYKWTLNATYDINYAKVYVLELASQQWMSGHTDKPIWKHWLTICKPNNYSSNHQTGLLFVNNGNNINWAVPTINKLDSFGGMLCNASGEITATLLQVPNQYIIFENDGVQRSEDDIVAYTWRKFMDTKDPTWLSLLPQTKSATKAMDAIQEFGKTVTGNYTIKKFIVTGASKRGWTAWGAAMVDKRVIGIAPMVIPILNLVDNIEAQVEAYGNWSFALKDYVNHNITNFLYTKYFKKVTKIIDPINYLNTLKPIAKFILLGTSDEFFLFDQTKSFFHLLKGETKLGIYPNTNHGGILQQSCANDIANFFKLVANGIERPEITWNIAYSDCKNYGTINLNVTKGVATKVLLWSATTISSTKRDFRMFTCNAAECYQNIKWTSQEINLSSSNNYSHTMLKPTSGWTGFFFQVIFSNGASYTSEGAVVPDVYPFPKCTMEVCGSGKPSWVKSNQNQDNDSDNEDDYEDIEDEIEEDF